MTASNNGFVGYPVALMALGSPAAVFLALSMLIESLLISAAAMMVTTLSSFITLSLAIWLMSLTGLLS